jgi:flagellin-like protein
MRSRKAVSPVIATVILVAVAITVAVAVAYWMGGISGQYTKFEKVEVKSAVCTQDSYGNWVVAVTLKNSGTATSTLETVYVNNAVCSNGTTPGSALDTLTTDLSYSDAYQLTSGEEQSFNVWVGATYGTLSSGTTVNVKIHSAGGMDYPKLVELV